MKLLADRIARDLRLDQEPEALAGENATAIQRKRQKAAVTRLQRQWQEIVQVLGVLPSTTSQILYLADPSRSGNFTSSAVASLVSSDESDGVSLWSNDENRAHKEPDTDQLNETVRHQLAQFSMLRTLFLRWGEVYEKDGYPSAASAD